MRWLAALAAFTVTLQPVKNQAPTFRYSRNGTYLVTNSLRCPVKVTISCGADYEPVFITVPARTAEELSIKEPDGREATCYLSEWSR